MNIKLFCGPKVIFQDLRLKLDWKLQILLIFKSPVESQILMSFANDIMSLTKLNYNACIYGDGLPVTLKFADSIGEILTAGKNLDTGVLPFKFYI